jgi:ankyrin repeat protein
MPKESKSRNRPSQSNGPYERGSELSAHTVNELRRQAKELAATSTWPESVIDRMNKKELITLLSNHAATVAAQTPQVRALALCASDRVGSTRELREMAREQGIANANTLTKQELCRALQIKLALPQNASVQAEDVEIPQFALDVLTQDVLIDPVVANDGYTYGYHSLRGLFVTEVNRFHQADRPASRPIRVVSPLNRAIVLSNPFDDIDGLPRMTPLFRNIAIDRQIRDWLDVHGLAKPDAPHVMARSDVPVHDPNFQQGIYIGDVGAQVADDEDGGNDDSDEEGEDVSIQTMNPLMTMVRVARASESHIEDIRRLIQTVDGDRQMLETYRGETALMMAVKRIGNDAVVALLLASRVSSQAARMQRKGLDEKGQTALMIAAQISRVTQTEATVARLLAHESGSDVVRMQNEDGYTALMLAAMDSNYTSTQETVAQLLSHESGGDVARVKDNEGCTALMLIVSRIGENSTQETVTQLLMHESGSDVARMKNKHGRTALMMAAYNSAKTSTQETVAQLLAHESSSDVARMKDVKGCTALSLAARYANDISTQETVAQLLSHESGGDVARMKDIHGYTALLYAVKYVNSTSTQDIVAQLLAHESGEDVARMADEYGYTPLMHACILSRIENYEATVAQLLAHESINYVARMACNRGVTALMFAAYNSSTQAIVAQLLAHESSSDVARMQDEVGDTALTVSLTCEDGILPAIVALLLNHESGRDMIRVRNNQGNTALMIARIKKQAHVPGSTEAVDLLTEFEVAHPE